MALDSTAPHVTDAKFTHLVIWWKEIWTLTMQFMTEANERIWPSLLEHVQPVLCLVKDCKPRGGFRSNQMFWAGLKDRLLNICSLLYLLVFCIPQDLQHRTPQVWERLDKPFLICWNHCSNLRRQTGTFWFVYPSLEMDIQMKGFKIN